MYKVCMRVYKPCTKCVCAYISWVRRFACAYIGWVRMYVCTLCVYKLPAQVCLRVCAHLSWLAGVSAEGSTMKDRLALFDHIFWSCHKTCIVLMPSVTCNGLPSALCIILNISILTDVSNWPSTIIRIL